MNPPVDTWYQAIATRHSRRNFTGEPIQEKVLSKLEAVSLSFHHIPGARSVLLKETPKGLFKGIVGSYGAINNAPHCIVLIGDMTQIHVQEAVGFHGEGIVLEATANGIDSCWIGGFLRKDELKGIIETRENEEILAVIAIGYAVESKSRIETMMSGLIGSERRKLLDDLLHLSSDIPKDWMLKALEAARRAPSAVNRQPWRFNIVDNSIEIFVKNRRSKSISPRLDCGICMLHLEIGALAAGVKGEWSFFTEEPFVRYSVT